MPTISTRLSPVGAAAVASLRAAAAYRTDDEVVRLALWHLAAHYGIDVPLDCFDDPAAPERRRARPRGARRGLVSA